MGNLLVRALVYNLIITSWVVLAGAIVHFGVQKLFRKAAFGIAIAWFSLLMIAEFGLTLYLKHNGYMLDSELWIRPFKEICTAIFGAVGIYVPLIAIVGIAGLTALCSIFLKRFHKIVGGVLPFTTIFVLLSLLFHTSHLMDGRAVNFISNRTYFLAVETNDYIKTAIEFQKFAANDYQVPYQQAEIDQFLSYHPEWEVEDRHYPLERVDHTPDVLSPYFKETEKRVDVVLILVESLGNEFMGSDCMPFVDSLARTGLYWKNCLSSTSRSWGALPTLTGSVNGPRGFQFSTMPEFNSLYAIFNENGYQTNHFQAPCHEFDCIYEYLQEQNIKYLSPFWEEHLRKKSSKNIWGYEDQVVFSKVLDILKAQNLPHFSSITTITMHEKLDLADEEQQQHYVRRAKANKRAEQTIDANPEVLASAIYTDDGLRDYLHQYRHTMPNWENTIFIITGDHASAWRRNQNDISYHYVPLIIWSPLLKEAKQFNSMVTHNDLAPSLCQLLKNRYHFTTPRTVHWLGDGLDTSSTMNKYRDMLIVRYDRKITEMIQGQYHYCVGDNWEEEQVNVFGDDLSLTPVNDPKIVEQCRRKFEVYKYLFSYTYFNNKLTKRPIYPKIKFTESKILHSDGDIHYNNPSYPPSKGGNECLDLFPKLTFDAKERFSKVQLTLKADVQFLDECYQDATPELVFYFMDGDKYVRESNHITKLLKTETIELGKFYPLQISKVFDLSDNPEQCCYISLCSTDLDDRWKPNLRIVIKNAVLIVGYAK